MKKTLHLPKAALPPRAKIADRPRYLKQCTDNLYAWQRARKLPKLTIHDGPPYANGELHIGHALNKILKDIICRYHVALGKHVVDWVPGWDCHGLPIEVKVLQEKGKERTLDLDKQEKKFDGIPYNQVDAINIRRAARALATRAVESQKKSFREWGVMADWDNAWTTMDRDFEIKQLEVFMKMMKESLIYRRFKPVYWSPSSRTALAEAELEYREDHVSKAAFIKFPLNGAPEALEKKLGYGVDTVNVVVWTTTPWTLPANRAIAFHRDIEYTIVESVTHGRLLLAASRIQEVELYCGEKLKVVNSVPGNELVGVTYRDTIFDSKSPPRPLLPARFVSQGSGSGLVHIAPGHGMDDYELCLQNDISVFAPLDDQGCYTAFASPDAPDMLLGKGVLNTGNQAVLDHLSTLGFIMGQHEYKHKYPYDWRSKQPVIIRATEQWFANVGDIQDDALQALDSVKFVPPSSKSRLQAFVKQRSEWCISRQRAWGVPIPALYRQTGNRPILDEESVTHIISVIKERGIDAWWTDDEADPAWIPPSLRNHDESTSFKRGRDTMDVWFDSGTSWTQILKPSETDQHIATYYIEGTDQHRGWFQSSLLTHIAYQLDGRRVSPMAPFKNLVTHGFVLDQHGRKMSKSVGNVISPIEIMDGTLLPLMKRKINGQATEVRDALGPDALRLWVASGDFTTDVKISPTVLQAINGSLSKYRVTFRLLLGILHDFNPNTCPRNEDLDTIHKIALWQLSQVDSSVQNYYRSLEFNRAVSEINTYISTSLSSFYFECIKDAAYCGTFKQRIQAQTALCQIFMQLQQMLLPVTPLLIEEIWDYTPPTIKDCQPSPPGQRMWTDFEPSLRESDIAGRLNDDFPLLMQAANAVNRAQETARNDKKMGDSLQSFVLLEIDTTAGNGKQATDLFHQYTECLETLFVVSRVGISHGKTPELMQAEWSYPANFDMLDCNIVAHVYTPTQSKCIRCWRYDASVEMEKDKALCARCKGVIVDLKKTKPELFGEVPNGKAADVA